MKKHNRIKTIIIASIPLLIVAMVLTCPKPDEHKEEVSKMLTEVVTGELGSHSINGYNIISGALIPFVVKNILETQLSVDNYFLFSVGNICNLEGEKKIISVGMFGHVFTFGKEKLREVLSNDSDEQKYNDDSSMFQNIEEDEMNDVRYIE